MLISSTAARVAGFFAASFVPSSVALAYFPVFLAGRGLSGAEIGILTALPMILRVTTASLLGLFADRLGDRRRALVLYAFLSLAGVAALWPATGFGTLLLATLATWAFWNGITPVSDAVAVSVARRGEGVYGRMRVWGSISFVVTNLWVGGIVAASGSEVVLRLLTIGMLMQFAAAFLVPSDRTAGEPARAPATPTREILCDLVADRRLAALAIGSALLQATHAMLYTFASLYWGTLGFSGSQVGVLWSTGVIGEILLFAFSGLALRAVGARGLMALGAAGAVARWLLFPLIGASMPLWVAFQGLHALTFAAVHLATIQLITATVDDRRAATVQGMLASLNGLAMATAMVASGPLYAAWGGRAFWAMAVVAAAGTAMVTIGLARPVPRPGR
ncbi:MFS transporter [Siculibacillus lacustris]|uniref:MFS transporter n=1 Tax=Siculibacillus lacustris TaxID=1549641 RepID=A0A4Q9VSX3_9HYPH|nr:MFS transporter [Siculibacillus lacustris]TBW38649.1 MFS transporter [Siculibacillus lacustris]